MVINFYSTVCTVIQHLMSMGMKILKKLLCTFHIIQLAPFLLVNHKPISGLMSAGIFLCWISIVNSVICFSGGKRNVFLTQRVSLLDLCQSFICILFNDLGQGWNSTYFVFSCF